MSHRRPSTGGSQEPVQEHLAVPKRGVDPGLTSAVFILFSWNYDLFWTSLQTYVAAGWGPRLIIIDNSKSRRMLNDAKVRPHAFVSHRPGTCQGACTSLR